MEMFGRRVIRRLRASVAVAVSRYLGLVRGVVVGIGLLLFIAGLNTVASMPPAPPESDGFVHGLAYMGALILGVAGLILVQIGYSLPSGTGQFQVGPLADRSTGLRSGVTVLLYFGTAAVMVYGLPHVVPSVTESTTYVTGLFIIVIAGVLGVLYTVLVSIAGFLIRAIRQRHQE